MSAVASNDLSSKSAARKKKKSKKKANGKGGVTPQLLETNGLNAEEAAGGDDEDDEDEGTTSPAKDNSSNHVVHEDTLHIPSSEVESAPPRERAPEQSDSNGAQSPRAERQESPVERTEEGEDGAVMEERPEPSALSLSASSRLDAMQQERDNLHAEVTQLRQSLESLQERHREELSGVREELEQSEQGKEQAETQYRNLLERVNTIRSQLGERLKADAAELEQAREKIEELESTNRTTQQENEHLQDSATKLKSQLELQTTEIESLRSRTNLSTSNWAKERDELISREAYVREEYEVAKQAMQDWEILATEERARREAFEEKAQELEEQFNSQTEAYERIRSEAETQSGTVDGLQRALREVQEERKRELRELVEQSEARLETLRKQTETAEATAAEVGARLGDMQEERDRLLPFEKEVKEKNLLIGKLRHEAVILNDHLTKALRFLKRGKPEDNVDRQLVTNHFLHFLALDRSDPKKFQILQLIAALLGWSEEQKEQAGLLRQGSMTATGSLKVPISPFRRTPSTPSLSTAFIPESPSGATKESLAELWSEFLEREAESGAAGSRRGSIRSPSITSVTSPIAGPPGRPRRKESSASVTSPGGAGG